MYMLASLQKAQLGDFLARLFLAAAQDLGDLLDWRWAQKAAGVRARMRAIPLLVAVILTRGRGCRVCVPDRASERWSVKLTPPLTPITVCHACGSPPSVECRTRYMHREPQRLDERRLIMKTIVSALLGLMVLMGVAVVPAGASQGWDGQSFWEAREHSWGGGG
jgi:hypothetical protein